MNGTIRGLALAKKQAADAVSAYQFLVRHMADSLRAYGCTLAHLMSPVGKAHAKKLRKNARRLREWRGMTDGS